MEKVLLVEDDSSLAFGLSYSLNREGYEVSHADCLKKAYRLLQSQPFSLILLDVILPDGNGYDFCRQLRENYNTPVIFLTACDDEINIITGLDIGADDYITKPFKVKELFSRIKAVLRRYLNNAYENSTIIDSADLTAIENRLLSILYANKNIILTRNQILDKLWDSKGNYVDDNTLSVHISRLRDKIGSEHIVTIRGVGYKWTD